MSVLKAQTELAEALADIQPTAGGAAQAERVKRLESAIDRLIVERIRAARALPPLPQEEPQCT